MQLYIGNKNYSSWSMRTWVLMREADIDFHEVVLRLDFSAGSPSRLAIEKVSPACRVPVLVDDGFAVWDTLAIAEYLAEQYPHKALWPADRLHRARARSLCAEMHSGFTALRSHFPMNIEASLPEVGARVLAENAEVRRDLQRFDDMWTQQLQASGGPLLFGRFSIADAYFAPVCTRIRSYGLRVSPAASRYVDTVSGLPSVQAWIEAALAEHDFLEVDEPYRSAPDPRA